MPSALDQHNSHTGLIYRARLGRPHDPLILMLHGLYGDENVMWLFDRALPRSATLISPRALFAMPAGFSWSRSVDHDEIGQTDFSEALEILPRFILEMIERYEGDAQRVVVMGFSQGAAVSYALSLTAPEVMCGVIALAGFRPRASTLPRRGSAPAALPRYLIIHSTDDPVVPIALAREARSELEARGADVAYHEYAAGGHKIAAPGMKDLAQWLTATLLY